MVLVWQAERLPYNGESRIASRGNCRATGSVAMVLVWQAERLPYNYNNRGGDFTPAKVATKLRLCGRSGGFTLFLEPSTPSGGKNYEHHCHGRAKN